MGSFGRDAYHTIDPTISDNETAKPAPNPARRRGSIPPYDTRSILSSITGPSGARVTFTNNSAGQPVTVTDPLGNTTVFSYNSGDLVGIADPLNHSSSRIADGAGRLLSITDPLGHRIRYEYDASSLLTRLVDALGASTTFAYDANGNLTGITDARGNLTAYAYDVMDRLISRTDPLLRTQTYATAQDGKVTSYQYDARNRPTFAGYGTVTLGGTTTYESTTTYTYDAGNRLTQVVDSLAGTTTFAYNDLDQITSIISPQGTVTYAYDAVGRRTRMTVAGQPDVTYSYDSRDRVTQIARGTSVVGFVYDADGRRTTLTLPNGITVQYSYDNDSRLTSITYQNGAAVLGDLNYGYDSAERRTSVGGMFARTGLPQPVSSGMYDSANQLTQWGTTALTYDANGSLTNDGTNTFSWDARGQLASISGSATASFQYDSFGQRISKTISGAETDFLYDGGNVVQELSGATVVANLLTGSTDEVFNRTDSSGTRTLLSDGIGGTLALADDSAVLQTQYTYEPFGASTSTGVLSSNSFQYTGRENDGTGLYYYRARYYNPQIGRFISEDPLKFAGGDVNFYAYVGNSPVSYVDPLGTQRQYFPPKPPFPPPAPTPPYIPPQPPNPVDPPPYAPYKPPVTHPWNGPEGMPPVENPPGYWPFPWPPFPVPPIDPWPFMVNPCLLEPWTCLPKPCTRA